MWIINTQEANTCQSNLDDSNRPSFMRITGHAGREVQIMSRILCDFSWTASFGISSVTTILCSFRLSASKSLQKAEDEDMLLTTLNLGKPLSNGDRTVSRGTIPLLKHYKTEDRSVLDEEDDRKLKFLGTGSRYDFLNHVMPINFGRKQLPYLALKRTMAFPADTEIQNIESIQERETADEENSAKFPIGRRDFDSKYISIFTQQLFHSGKV
ncbi:pro-MCH isoform 1-T1 [Guaruba guarouba]